MTQPAFKINALLRGDPTRTLTLRNRFVSDVNARYRKLKGDINRKLIDENFLAPIEYEGPPTPPQVITFPGLAKKYTYKRSAAKMEEFNDWLVGLELDGILEIMPGPGIGQQPWTNTYIQSAYQSNMIKARNDLRAAGAEIPNFNQVPGGINAVFNQPFHADRVALAYSRTFNGMKGITADMNTQLSHQLATGMAQGLNPREIARNINKRTDVGMTRARRIARTEVVQSANEAALNEFENAEAIIGEEILVQWWSALDDRVRPSHGKYTGPQRVGPPAPKGPLMQSADDLAGCVMQSAQNVAYIGLRKPKPCSDFTRVGDKWYKQGKEVSGSDLDRLNGMKVPPNWEQVVVATDPTSKVQAIGMDKVGRWHYKYSAEHVGQSSIRKFDRVKSFSGDMPQIRRGIKKGMKANDPRAYLLELENRTAIRMGSATDFKAQKKAYGLTTLQNEHVIINGNKITLDFVAKKGIPVNYEFEDAALAKWLGDRKASTAIGDKLFPDVPAPKLNSYLKELAGGKSYTIKDFRTYHGTRMAYEELLPYSGQTLTTVQKKAVIKRTTEKVSGFLKNTPIMARDSYIDPMVWDLIGGL